jgi:hypothetical protein
MLRRIGASLALAALTFADARAEVAPAPSSFDYLYIRAHEGGASGGHAAIRFGDDTFDFQHSDGWLVPRRDDSRRFQHTYRTLENRGIELSRVEASPETVARLRAAFGRRLLAQTRQLALLGELERDAALLEALAAGEAPPVPVRGAGFFERDAGAAAADAPAVLSELRARIAAQHGDGWLRGRCAEALRALREASLAPADVGSVRADPLVWPVARETLSRHAARALAAQTACEVLAQPRALRAGVRAGEGLEPDPWLRLDAARRARLLEFRAAQLDAAVALAASRRPDWGEALLLASARLALIDESLAQGELVLLDAFPADARALRVGPRRRALLPQLGDDVRADLVQAYRRVFSGGAYREAAWGALEEAVTRSAELRAVSAGGSRLRVAPGALLPEGGAERPVSGLVATRGELGRAAQAARAELSALRRALAAEYRYDLVGRNCVTELFRTIELGLVSKAGAPPGADRDAIRALVRRESQRELGGYVDPVAAANFVPFVSSRRVRSSWRVSERVHLESAREHALARDAGLAAALRESNVLTSSVYEPDEEEGFFLFFTDGSWVLRPLLGAANLAVALARSGVGVFQLPFDRGDGLRSGLDGALWSAPELFFVNIRKGTNEYVPPEQRPPPG